MEYEVDKYYLAHPLSEIKGLLFNFERKSKSQRFGARICLDTQREEILALCADTAIPFITVFSAAHGQPGSLAYRLLIGIERRLNDKKESEFTATALELFELANVSKSAQRYSDLKIALDQLAFTVFHYHSKPFLKTRKNIQNFFSVISYSVDRTNRSSIFRIKVHHIITDALYEQRKFHIYNFARIADLQPAIQCFSLSVLNALTTRRISYIKQGETGTCEYSKAYDSVCRDWIGGTTPNSNHSRANNAHIKLRIKPLIDREILHPDSHLCAKTMNLFLYPGKAFLADYKAIYPAAGRTAAENKLIDGLIEHFDACLRIDRAPQHLDRAHAQVIIKKYGPEEARQYVRFGAQMANETNFEIKFLAGIKTYDNLYEKHRPAPSPKEVLPPTPVEIADYEVYLSSFYKKHFDDLAPHELIKYKERYEMLIGGSYDKDQTDLLVFARRQAIDFASSSAPVSLETMVHKIRSAKTTT